MCYRNTLGLHRRSGSTSTGLVAENRIRTLEVAIQLEQVANVHNIVFRPTQPPNLSWTEISSSLQGTIS